MPVAVQNIMLAAPTTHYVRLAQAILYRGAGLDVVWPQLLRAGRDRQRRVRCLAGALPRLGEPRVRVRIAMRVAAALCSLGACAVDPTTSAPEPPVTPTFARHAAEESSIADSAWFDVFSDPVLRQLVDEALGNNRDLQVAVARVEKARYSAAIARSPLFPQVGYGGVASRGKQATFGLEEQGSPVTNSFLLALAGSWELDVWGRIRRSAKSARADLLSTDAVRRGVVLSLVSQVAQSYFELRELDLELQIATDAAKSFQETYDMFNRPLHRRPHLDARPAARGGVARALHRRGRAGGAEHPPQGERDLPAARPARAERAARRGAGGADPRAAGPRGSARAAAQSDARPDRVGAAARRGERADRRGLRELLPAHRPDGDRRHAQLGRLRPDGGQGVAVVVRRAGRRSALHRGTHDVRVEGRQGRHRRGARELRGRRAERAARGLERAHRAQAAGTAARAAGARGEGARGVAQDRDHALHGRARELPRGAQRTTATVPGAARPGADAPARDRLRRLPVQSARRGLEPAPVSRRSRRR